MLTTPGPDNRPLYAAKDIVPFYLDNCPKIFPQSSGPWGSTKKILSAIVGPKYDGTYLHQLIRDKLGDTKLHQTLTNVVIPTFDIKLLHPTIFSSYQLKSDPSKDALLSDICISTSAAPTFLPAYHFETINEKGEMLRSFDLVDGGVAANNPTLVALSEASRESVQQNPDFITSPSERKRYLVISLGTGSAKTDEKYSAGSTAKWGAMKWLFNHGSSPLIETFSQSSADMVDFHLSTVFQTLGSQENYLRIQDDTLSGDATSVDKATKKNLANLVKVGEALLDRSISRVNLETGVCEPTEEGTNKDALIRLAKVLSEERKRRLTVETINETLPGSQVSPLLSYEDQLIEGPTKGTCTSPGSQVSELLSNHDQLIGRSTKGTSPVSRPTLPRRLSDQLALSLFWSMIWLYFQVGSRSPSDYHFLTS